MPEIVITPTSGRITAGDHQTFDITFNSTHAQVFEVSVNVEIAGAQHVRILPYTFFNCTSLKNIESLGMARIGQSAFELCTNLTTVECRYVDYLYDRAFCECTSLEYVMFDEVD